MSFEEWKSAVIQGDVAAVKTGLQDPAIASRINECVFAFDSPAVFPCRENLPMLDALLEHGADLNKKTEWGCGGFGILEGVSPAVADPLMERGATLDIWSAACLNRIDDVKAMLADNPQLIQAPGGDGKHPLHYAGTVEMVDLLVDAGADVNARDMDHSSTPLQYQINQTAVARRLLERGAEPDVFAAAALGDSRLVAECLAKDPNAANARLGDESWRNEFGGSIYNWQLGHDLTPTDVARSRGHNDVLQQLLSACVPERQLTDAIWNGESEHVDQLLTSHPQLLIDLSEDAVKMLPRAAWWYRPQAVKKMLELGFDPHVVGAHDSTPLDRAAFHGYSDIVATLLHHDPNPPLDRQNEFGGTPLGACIWGFRNGWKTGHPQDHYATARLLLEAGSRPAPDASPVGDPRLDDLLAQYS